jgi:hypothetical protein
VNENFFEDMPGELALRLCDEITKRNFAVFQQTPIHMCNSSCQYAAMKDIQQVIDIESIKSRIPISVKSNKIKERVKRIFLLRFQNPVHEQEFENWYTQQQLHSYAMIAIYVIFFSGWHAFWDTRTFCDDKLKFKSPSLCLDTPTGYTILIFRIAYFAGIPLMGLLFGTLKCIPEKVKEMVAIVLIGLYTYGHIFWSSYLSLGNSSDNTKVRNPHFKTFDRCTKLNLILKHQLLLLEYFPCRLLHRYHHAGKSL